MLKNPGLLEASPSVRFEFVRTDEHGMGVKKACEALGVSRGGYYAFLNRPKSSRQIAREALEPFVQDISCASNRRYGSRRIVVGLRKIGIVANDKTARRMMARKGPASCRGPRKYSRGGKASDKGANVLNREFSVQKRNSMWCGDIACIPTREGWPCLATRLDLFSRKIVGWQVSPRINENLAIDALDNAVNREDPEEGLMAHADRGSQCTSNRFCGELENRGFVQSFSHKGRPCGNAVMESFFKTPKRELPLDRKYDTRIEAKQEVFKFIEPYCNIRRQHSPLGSLSPVEYERQCALDWSRFLGRKNKLLQATSRSRSHGAL